MIRISNARVTGWETATYGMRNPMCSWDRSDSYYAKKNDELVWVIGENDRKLMMQLAKAGGPHAKYRRYIHVSFDIDAPLYFWKDFDTYRVGVDRNPTDTEFNSCSSYYDMVHNPITPELFSHDQLFTRDDDTKLPYTPYGYLVMTCELCEHYRRRFLETNDKRYWWQMQQLLPISFNQLRTVDTNYQALSEIYKYRKDHRLDEFRDLCKFIKTLPYSELITLEKASA